jgi:hypothetical protein
MPDWRPSPLELRDGVRATLAGAGLSEVVTHALVGPGHVEQWRLRKPVASVGDDRQPARTPIVVTNPLSRDHSVLRQGLVGSLVGVVSTTLRHGREVVAIFEVAGYGRDGAQTRSGGASIALTGAAEPRVERPARLPRHRRRERHRHECSARAGFRRPPRGGRRGRSCTRQTARVAATRSSTGGDESRGTVALDGIVGEPVRRHFPPGLR